MSTEFINDQWRLPNAWNGTESNVNKQSNYSMEFNSASSDYISIPNTSELQITGELSISFWIKTANTQTSITGVVSKAPITNSIVGLAQYHIEFFGTNNELRFILTGLDLKAGTETTGSVPAISLNTWEHITMTWNGSNEMIVYKNGQQVCTKTQSTTIASNTEPVLLGKRANKNSLNGQLDAVSIFNYELSSSQVTTLYGSSSTGIGNPMTLNPVAFYQLGDKSAFNGADYLVPNIAAEEADGDIATSFSPYALDFDGANDYIDCGDSDDFSFGNGSTDSPFSISAWVNWRSISANNPPFVSKWGSSLKEWLFILNNDGKIRFYLIGGGGNVQKISATTLSSNTWYHVTATYDGSGGSTAYNGMNLYINGVKENATNAGAAYNAMTNTSQPVEISRYQANRYFDGKISNASIWNTELTQAQVSEIYNEGVPSNLNNHSAYSNLVSWWQLGSNSSFNTNWTVLDEKGSNDGTSANMGEDAIVDGVGSYANGLSSGMGGDEVIGDAPYSTANALSVNMDVEDRVTDTPS